MSIEKVIFSNLIMNQDYGRKVIPFLKDEYFSDYTDKNVFKLVDEYVKKYNSFPTKEALLIDLRNLDNISQETYDKSKEMIDSLSTDDNTKIEWLVDQTEKFLTDNADKFTEGEAATKKAELDEALALLKTDLNGANFESIKSNTEKVSTISQALGAMMYANASAQTEGAAAGSEDHVEDAEVIDAEEAN